MNPYMPFPNINQNQDIRNLEKHFMYYLVEMISIIE